MKFISLKINLLSDIIAQNKSKLSLLENENSKLKEYQEKSELEIKEAKNKMEESAVELNRSQEVKIELTKKLEKLSEEYELMNNSKADVSKELKEARIEMGEKSNIISKLEAEILHKDQQMKDVMNKLAKTSDINTDEVNEMRIANERLQSQVEDLAAMNKSLNEKLESNSKILGSYNDKINSEKEKLEDLEIKLADKDRELICISDKLQETENQLKQVQANFQTVNERNKDLISKIESNPFESEVKSLNNEKDKLLSDLQAKDNELESSVVALSEIKVQLLNLKEIQLKLEVDLQRSNSQNEELNKNYEKLTTEYQTIKNELTKSQKENKELNETVSYAIKEKEANIISKEKELGEAKSEKEKMNIELENFIKKLTETEKNLQETEIKLSTLQQSYGEKQRDLENERQKNTVQRDTTVKLENEIDELREKMSEVLEQLEKKNHNKAIDDLSKDKIKEKFELEKENLLSKLDLFQKKIDEQSLSIQNNEKEKNQLENIMSDQKSKLERFDSKIKMFEAKNIDLKEELSKAKFNVDLMQENSEETIAENEVLQTKLDNLQQALNNIQRQMNEKSKELSDMGKFKEETKEKLSNYDLVVEENSTVKDSMEILKKKYDDMCEKYLSMESSFKEEKISLQSLTIRNEKLSEEKVDLEKLLEEKEMVLNNMHEKLKICEKESKFLSNRIKNLEELNLNSKKELENAMDDIFVLKSDTSKRLDDEKEQLLCSCNDKGDIINKLKTDVEYYSSKLSLVEKEVEHRGDQLDNSESNSLEKEQEIRDLKEKISEITAINDFRSIDYKNSIEALKQQLNDTKDVNKNLQSAYDELKSKDDMKNTSNRESTSIEENCNLSDKFKAKCNELNEVKNSYEALQKDTEQLKLELLKTEESLKTIISEKKKLSAKIKASSKKDIEKNVFEQVMNSKEVENLKILVNDGATERCRLQQKNTELEHKIKEIQEKNSYLELTIKSFEEKSDRSTDNSLSDKEYAKAENENNKLIEKDESEDTIEPPTKARTTSKKLEVLKNLKMKIDSREERIKELQNSSKPQIEQKDSNEVKKLQSYLERAMGDLKETREEYQRKIENFRTMQKDLEERYAADKRRSIDDNRRTYKELIKAQKERDELRKRLGIFPISKPAEIQPIALGSRRSPRLVNKHLDDALLKSTPERILSKRKVITDDANMQLSPSKSMSPLSKVVRTPLGDVREYDNAKLNKRLKINDEEVNNCQYALKLNS